MLCPLLIFSQSDYLIPVVDTNSYTMTSSEEPDQYQKPADLDLDCLQRQGISGFSRNKVDIKIFVLRLLYSEISDQI